MLLSFTIQNFKSVLDLTLSMRFDEGAAPNGYKNRDTYVFLEDQKERVSPILAVYGANASGKSNIIKAMRTFCNLILYGVKNTIFAPNKLNNKYNDTSFEAEFLLGGKLYTYKLTYNEKTILEETLLCKDSVLFSCKNRKLKKISESNKYYDKTKLHEIYKIECKDYNQNQIHTFLKKLAKNYSNLYREITEVYNYLADKTEVCVEQPYSNYYALDNLNTELNDEKLALSKIAELTKKFDIDIDSIFYEKKEARLNEMGLSFPLNDLIDVDKINNKLLYGQFYTNHKNINNETVTFYIQEESQGTQTIIPIIGVVLATLERGGVLFIDELDRSLHPLLLIQLTNLFKDKRYNKKNAQLVFTLHCTDLLEDDLIRKSEVGIVSKNKKDGSTFVKLSHFKELRSALDFRKRYLTGEFSGIPYAYI